MNNTTLTSQRQLRIRELTNAYTAEESYFELSLVNEVELCLLMNALALVGANGPKHLQDDYWRLYFRLQGALPHKIEA